jgi:hypothetical protein
MMLHSLNGYKKFVQTIQFSGVTYVNIKDRILIFVD